MGALVGVISVNFEYSFDGYDQCSILFLQMHLLIDLWSGRMKIWKFHFLYLVKFLYIFKQFKRVKVIFFHENYPEYTNLRRGFSYSIHSIANGAKWLHTLVCVFMDNILVSSQHKRFWLNLCWKHHFECFHTYLMDLYILVE